MNKSEDFDLFWEWFYPKHFTTCIEGSLNAYHASDQVVSAILKFLAELVLQKDGIRFTHDQSTGVVIFKESSKPII